MAKSNWKGTSGWGAINDPTGVLNGRVLVTSAGLTATNEDYLTTIVGTSTAFSADHYSVYLDYAFPNYDETHPLIAGKLGLIARASNFNGDPEKSYDCYIGQLDVENKKVNILRRNQDSETTLISADMPNTAISRGSKHTLEFRCYGTTQPTLQFLIDNSLVANIGDISSSKLLQGFPGIQMRNGTAYCDTFTVSQYTSTGATPELWTPMQVASGLTLSAWYIGNEGVTTTGTTISSWSDQSVNTNNLTASGSPQLKVNNVNNYDVVNFAASSDEFSTSDNSTLDMATDGVSIFAVVNISDYTLGGNIIAKNQTYDLLNSATSGYKFIGDPSDVSTPSSFVGITNTFSIVEAVTDKDADTGIGGIYVDGLNASNIAFNVGSDNANNLILGGDAFSGGIAEIVLIKGECNQENRQLVEGYLAHKYATSSLLPNDHPYKNYAPIQQ
jgi:hypothetical protein